MNLFFSGLIDIALVTIFLALERTAFGRAADLVKQVVIGLFFGLAAVFACEFGLFFDGLFFNVRDSAPICAGLFFGGPAALIAGAVGAAYRWFIAAGDITRAACTVATIFSSLAACVARKFIFRNRKPIFIYAFLMSCTCEDAHLILIFLFDIAHSYQVFSYIQHGAIIMVIANCLTITVAFLIDRAFSNSDKIKDFFFKWRARVFSKKSDKKLLLDNLSNLNNLSTSQQGGLGVDSFGFISGVNKDRGRWGISQIVSFGLVLIFFVVTVLMTSFTFKLQSSLFEFQTYLTIKFVLRDLSQDIKDIASEYMRGFYDKDENARIASIYKDDPEMIKIKKDEIKKTRYERFKSDMDIILPKVMTNRKIGHLGFSLVLNARGIVIGGDSAYIGININDLEIEEKRLSSANDLYWSQIEGVNYYYTYLNYDDFLLFGFVPFSEAVYSRDATICVSVMVQFFLFASLMFFIYALIERLLVRNIAKVNKALVKITEGDLNAKVCARGSKEFIFLSDSVNSTVSALKGYIKKEAERIDKELRYAAQIQQASLPKRYPDNKTYQIYAGMVAAKDVGGDFYDFFEIKKRGRVYLFVLVADVSGKGIGAALFMMTVKAVIKGLIEQGLDIGEILDKANERLCAENEQGLFVTVWMGCIDLSSGVLCYVNAGHNPPALFHGGKWEYLRARSGFVLAGLEGTKYKVFDIKMDPGDKLFLYTDGVTEATDRGLSLYGEGRLMEYLSTHSDLKVTELLHEGKKSVDKFVNGAV